MSEALKIPRTIARLEDAPGPLRPFFEQKADGFHLRLDDPDAGKLSEFRENNRALNTKLAEAEGKLKAFDGIDPAEYVALKSRIAELEGQTAAASESATKLAELQAALTEKDTTLRNTQRRASVVAAFGALGGELKAGDYVDQLAAATFQVGADGQLTTSAVDGEGLPLTVESWLVQQQRERPFLFRPSKGAGTATSQGPANVSVPRVSRHDIGAFGANLEGIARGTVQLSD